MPRKRRTFNETPDERRAIDAELQAIKEIDSLRENASKKINSARRKEKDWGPSALTYDALRAAMEAIKNSPENMPIYNMKALMQSLGVDLALEAAVNREPKAKKVRTKAPEPQLQAPADAPEGYVPRNIILIRREP
jgi:hypothetical protein